MKIFALVITLLGIGLSVGIYLSKNYQYEHYVIEPKSDRIKVYKINLNLANEREYDNLPGIGPKLAQEIIRDRSANGRFNSVEEINRVKGIGDAKFKKIEPYLTMEVQ